MPDQPDRAQRSEANNPPQHLLNNGERALDDIDKRLSRIAHLQGRNTDSPRNHEHLEHVKGDRRCYTGVGGFRGDLKP